MLSRLINVQKVSGRSSAHARFALIALALSWITHANAVVAAPPVAASSGSRAAGSQRLREALAIKPVPNARAQRGYELLTTKAYLPPDFDQQTFDEIWKSWEEPARGIAEAASADERRRMAFSRYGLTERPNDPQHRPLQYVVDRAGNWSMNCLACHSGKVAGKPVPGAPNTHYALETLVEDVRTTKLRLGKKLTHMDVGSVFMPLGTTNGTTNAVMFGVVLLNYRDADLNIVQDRPRAATTHHDHDAPPWWHFHKKEMLYIDGFAPKGHRALMQFNLVKENGPQQFRDWESDFVDIYAYLDSLRPPKYPEPIDESLADAGRTVFTKSCASCHGTYGGSASGEPRGYPEKRVPIDVVGTDRVRLDALSVKHREHYAESWFANYNQPPVVTEPAGYVAPPLDGVWASAPYLHNGSIPTLWHLLNSAERPVVWSRTEDGYDHERVGLEVQTFEELPTTKSNAERRRFFDTRVRGKSAAGHTFPDKLSEEQKRAVLEYLKTL